MNGINILKQTLKVNGYTEEKIKTESNENQTKYIVYAENKNTGDIYENESQGIMAAIYQFLNHISDEKNNPYLLLSLFPAKNMFYEHLEKDTLTEDENKLISFFASTDKKLKNIHPCTNFCTEREISYMPCTHACEKNENGKCKKLQEWFNINYTTKYNRLQEWMQQKQETTEEISNEIKQQ